MTKLKYRRWLQAHPSEIETDFTGQAQTSLRQGYAAAGILRSLPIFLLPMWEKTKRRCPKKEIFILLSETSFIQGLTANPSNLAASVSRSTFFPLFSKGIKGGLTYRLLKLLIVSGDFPFHYNKLIYFRQVRLHTKTRGIGQNEFSVIKTRKRLGQTLPERVGIDIHF